MFRTIIVIKFHLCLQCFEKVFESEVAEIIGKIKTECQHLENEIPKSCGSIALVASYFKEDLTSIVYCCEVSFVHLIFLNL